MLVVLGACQPDLPVAAPEPEPVVVTTTTQPVSVTTTTLEKQWVTLPTTTTTKPTATPVSLPATTTTEAPDPAFLTRRYKMYERDADVVQLQVVLGLNSVDGIYGPITRAAHVDALGGPTAVVYLWFPELAQGTEPGGEESSDAHSELPTLGKLVERFFRPEDQAWAMKVAFCESSARASDTGSTQVSHALAVGWFQHLAKYWLERSASAGWEHHDIFNGEANVAVAAWLFYEGGGARHWNPSRTCWERP